MRGEKEIYACVECGYQSAKWFGRCPQCSMWDTLKKAVVPIKSEDNRRASKRQLSITNINDVKTTYKNRLSTKSSEFDRVLGGGIVRGEVILIGGEPGIGKTTLLLQLLHRVHSRNKKCLYISAEESIEQISLHAKRLDIETNMPVSSENDIDTIITSLEKEKPALVVLDSIQTVKTEDMRGLPGGIGQVKECTSRMVGYAKRTGSAVILVGHITKGGDIAGPKVLEHIVDAVLYIEGDTTTHIRLIRGVKNRFGSTREVGVFSFSSKGFRDASNPSEVFIRSDKPRIGVCKSALFEGKRVILVEIQALSSKSGFSLPQRVVSGIKKSKIQMICALLSKYTKVRLGEMDVYVNVANGIKVDDSSMDLAICIALASSYQNYKISPSKIAIGEVSLTGEIYETAHLQAKLNELIRLGYNDIIIPKRSQKISKGKTLSYIDSVSSLGTIFK